LNNIEGVLLAKFDKIQVNAVKIKQALTCVIGGNVKTFNEHNSKTGKQKLKFLTLLQLADLVGEKQHDLSMYGMLQSIYFKIRPIFLKVS